MKRYDIKSLAAGIIIGIIGVTTVFAAGGIKSAAYSNAKVYFYGEEVLLKNPLVTIVKDGSSEGQLYMPMRDLLEYMQFNVQWNSKDGSVNLTMNGDNNNKDPEAPTGISENEADTTALDIMQRTGNWSYIEQYLKDMTEDGIEKVIKLYNSKHIDPSEHKKASYYIKKEGLGKSSLNSEVQIATLAFKLESASIESVKKPGAEDEGYKLLNLELSVKNNGTKEEQLTSVMAFKLTDIDGQAYNIVLPEEQGLNGLIKPQGELEGKISFKVKAEKKDFKLEIKPWITMSKKAYIDIKL